MSFQASNNYNRVRLPQKNNNMQKTNNLTDAKANQIEQELKQEFKNKVANLNLTNNQKIQLQQTVDAAVIKFKNENRGKFNTTEQYREALGKLIGDTTQKYLDSVATKKGATEIGASIGNSKTPIDSIPPGESKGIKNGDVLKGGNKSAQIDPNIYKEILNGAALKGYTGSMRK